MSWAALDAPLFYPFKPPSWAYFSCGQLAPIHWITGRRRSSTPTVLPCVRECAPGTLRKGAGMGDASCCYLCLASSLVVVAAQLAQSAVKQI